MRYYFVLLAAAFAAAAQSQPYQSVAVATKMQNQYLSATMVTDWNRGISYVITDSKITAVNHADGTTDAKSLSDVHYACISSSGLIAVTSSPSSGIDQIPETVQTIAFDGPGSWTVRKLNLGLAYPTNFAGFAHCAFAPDGTLWLASSELEASGTPKIAHVDVDAQKVMKFWPTDQYALDGVVATSDGVYFGVSYPRTQMGGLGTIGSDGQYHLLSQWTAISGNIVTAPNGNIYANNRVFTPQGQPLLSYDSIGSFGLATWPSTDSWFTYIILGGKIVTADLYRFIEGRTIGTRTDYAFIAAHRKTITNDDGSSSAVDVVIAARDGVLDFFQVTPPPMAHFAAHAATFQTGPLAPGSFFSIFGQGLSAHVTDQFMAGPEISTTLGQTQVLFDGKPMRLSYVGDGQINAYIPESAVNGTHGLTVKVGSTTVNAVTATVTDQAIAAFAFAPDPDRNPRFLTPIATDATGHLIGNPSLASFYAQASGGDTIVIYGTGGGRTNPAIGDNVESAGGLHPFVIQPTVYIGGVQATVAYGGRTPGIPGLDQLNVVVPQGLASGATDLTITSSTGAAITYPGGLWLK